MESDVCVLQQDGLIPLAKPCELAVLAYDGWYNDMKTSELIN